jgi:hypothetical protein
MKSKEVAKRLENFLTAQKGFVYQRDCLQPSTEATLWCFAALKFNNLEAQYADSILSWLKKMQNFDGSVKINEICQGQANWVASQYACFMEIFGENKSAEKALKFVLQNRSMTYEQNPYAQQDNSLVGWPWTKKSFSWVEPTSWALLALKSGGLQDRERYKEGIKLLKDRMIAGKGWNCGAGNVYSTDLIPFIDVSALALIAIKDEIEFEKIAEIIDSITKEAMETPSLYAVAMVIHCLKKFKLPVDALLQRLTRLLKNQPDTIANSQHLAVASLALSEKVVF